MASYLVVFSWVWKLQLCRADLAAHFFAHSFRTTPWWQHWQQPTDLQPLKTEGMLTEAGLSVSAPSRLGEELWPHFTPLKMSVWRQMKHSSVKWNERSRSNCWIETCNYASLTWAPQVHRWRAAAFSRELSRKKWSAVKVRRSGPRSGSREQTKEKTESEIPVSCQEGMKTCVVTREDSFILVFL